MAYRKAPRALINPAALIAIREARGFSQSELSRRAHVNQSHISVIERGGKDPDASQAPEVAWDAEVVELIPPAKTTVRLTTAQALAAGLEVPLAAILAMPAPVGEMAS